MAGKKYNTEGQKDKERLLERTAGGSVGSKKLVTVNRYPKPAVPFPGPKFSGGWLSGHIHCLENFLECVRDNRPASPSFYEGIYNVRLLDKVRTSETRGLDLEP